MNGQGQVINRKAVALVFDPDFGAHVESIAKEMPVWIMESQGNNKAVDKARKSLRESVDITVFFYHPGESKNDYFARVLYSLDEHEGTISKPSGYDDLLIYGVFPDEVDVNVLNELGFADIEKTVFGCRAGRKIN